MQIPHSKDDCPFAVEGPICPGWLNAPARLGGDIVWGCDGMDITKPVIPGIWPCSKRNMMGKC